MPGIGSDLAPSMASQHPVDSRRRNLLADPFLVGRMNGRDDDDPAILGLFEPGSQKGFLLVRAQELAMTSTPTILVGIGRSSVFPERASHDADLVSAEAQDPGGGLIEAQASAGIKIACP